MKRQGAKTKSKNKNKISTRESGARHRPYIHIVIKSIVKTYVIRDLRKRKWKKCVINTGIQASKHIFFE